MEQAPIRAAPSTADLESKRQALEADSVGAASGEIFSQYRPTHNLGGVDHPADIAEAASLAATPSPAHTYPLADAISCELVDKGLLSSLQLESISLACQRHLTILPTAVPTRAAFFLGDGAGVGKGRQLAGMIYDNLARGRPRHLWFSSSSDLRVDAQRDLADVGLQGVTVIDGCQGLDRSACKGLGLSKDMHAGVLFSTYATLVSVTASQKAKGASRLQQLVDWCGGPAFEGCLLFDECHKAKNWSGKEDTSSQISKAVLELQRALPLACAQWIPNPVPVIGSRASDRLFISLWTGSHLSEMRSHSRQPHRVLLGHWSVRHIQHGLQ